MRCVEASSSRTVVTIGTSSARRSRLRLAAGAARLHARSALELPAPISRRSRRPRGEALEVSRVDEGTRPARRRDACRRRVGPQEAGLDRCLELADPPRDGLDLLDDPPELAGRAVPKDLATRHRAGRFFGRSSRGRRRSGPPSRSSRSGATRDRAQPAATRDRRSRASHRTIREPASGDRRPNSGCAEDATPPGTRIRAFGPIRGEDPDRCCVF